MNCKPKIKSCTLYWLSQPGAPVIIPIFKRSSEQWLSYLPHKTIRVHARENSIISPERIKCKTWESSFRSTVSWPSSCGTLPATSRLRETGVPSLPDAMGGKKNGRDKTRQALCVIPGRVTSIASLSLAHCIIHHKIKPPTPRLIPNSPQLPSHFFVPS